MNATDIITRITADLGLHMGAMTAADWQLITICLEDGETLEALGITDDEQEAVEEAHSLAKDKRREALLATAAAAAPEAQGDGEVEYEFEVWQNDSLLAGGSTSDYTTAKSEADHYAFMYGQDGPVEVRMYVKRQITSPPNMSVGVEGLMQLAREWCLSWGEWAHDADPGCAKENAAEAALRAALTQALSQQPAACPKCGGTGEADSGGIMPWGAPAMIPCDCQQPGAVEAKDAEIEALRAEVERLRQLVNGGRGPLPAGAVAWLDMSPGEASLTFDKKSDSNRANKRRVMELFHRVSAGYYPLYLEPQADRAERLADPTATQENDDA